MKVIPIALASQYVSGGSTLARFLKVTRRDGAIFGLSNTDREVTVGAVTYRPGYEPSDHVSTVGVGVNNSEITIYPDDDDGDITRVDLLAGLWDNAAFEVFECNYLSPADGINVIDSGTTGEVQLMSDRFVVEFRGINQALQQPVGMVTQKTCRANFADFPSARLHAPCRLDPSDWTVTGNLTSAASRQFFIDAARSEPEDWFTDGVLTWTGGLNAGYSQKVKKFSVGGQITLSLPMFFSVEVGDTYSLIAGCQKRHDVDCRDKFNNILNFQGEPHLVGVDLITGAPD